MSDVAQGQGWWVAADGKWYPPELHPTTAGARSQVTSPARTGSPGTASPTPQAAPLRPAVPSPTPSPPPTPMVAYPEPSATIGRER